MREIILDTETTGLNPRGGDRLIEIGCVELINRYPTGREYHVFINPERDVPAEAQAVHGITTEFLRDKPLFSAAGGRVPCVHRRRHPRHPQRKLRHRLPERRARTACQAGDRHGSRRRHAGPCPPQASVRSQQPRRAVQALRRRQHQARQARRLDGQRAADRGLSGTAGRTPGRADPGDGLSQRSKFCRRTCWPRRATSNAPAAAHFG